MRVLVVDRLRADYPGARIIHELPLRYSKRRLDLAAVLPDRIIGVEVKSSRDNLDRLLGQVQGFRPICATLIIAAAPRWLARPDPVWEERVVQGRMTRQLYHPDHAVGAAMRGHPYRGQLSIWRVDADQGELSVYRSAQYDRVHIPHSAEMLDMLHVSELCLIAARAGLREPARSVPTHASIVRTCWDGLTGRQVVRATCAAIRSRDAFDPASDPPVPLAARRRLRM